MTKTTTPMLTLDAAAIDAAFEAMDTERAVAEIAEGLTPMAEKKKAAAPSIAAKKRKAAAGARKQFLANLAQLAELAASTESVAGRLEMTESEFVKRLDTDTQAAAVWRQGLVNAEIRARSLLWELAKDGNSAAARQIVASFESAVAGSADWAAVPTRTLETLLGEKTNWVANRVVHDAMPRNVDNTVDLGKFLPWYREYIAKRAALDPQRMKQVDLIPILGVSKNTLIEWTKASMPRQADGTYSLAAVVAWRIEQIGTRPEKNADPINPLQQLKADKLQIEVDAARGKLIARDAVLSGLVARHQSLVLFLNRKIGELPPMLENSRVEKITTTLSEVFDSIRETLCHVPDHLQLSESAAEAFGNVLKVIDDESHE